jgi:hypothetical protein
VKSPLSLAGKTINYLIVGANKGLTGRTIFISGLFFFLMTQVLMATGSIRSKVVDKETKEDLSGVNIAVANMSLGASSYLDGNFVIHGIPAGEQTTAILYFGYSSVTLQAMVVILLRGSLLRMRA